MDIHERFQLIKEVGEELVTKEELMDLLTKKKKFIAYDGFEPSGRIHIAQGILRAINVNKMTKAGAKFKMWVADWHGWANNKMGGDLERIQTVGKYFIEVWKASGMDLENVEFVWASEAMGKKDYWKIVMQVARNSTLNRVLRTTQIMGRSEKDILQASQILYPCMQVADIFYLKADVCQLGMDQRKVNVLAREIGEKIGFWKPIIVSHHMLMGLQQPVSEEKDAVERAIDMKMSKSKPDTAIFMTDSEDDVFRKMQKAWCPEKQIKENPVMEYCKHIVFEKYDKFEIKRPEKFGGNLTIKSYEELEKLYADGKIHPLDLKKTVAFYINELLIPVRKHFEKDKEAKRLKELVESYEVTR
ncbi:tyrosine--tRNA ligase [Candidatus Woesearchaeota archaeon]|nr:tyrosine--tRNA ligase [Candidatus Woesearchaeota archaeon]